MGYSTAGSLLWELAGETSPPSINDEFTTGFGGTLLGEPLYRMASLLLESGIGKPGFWRELGAAALSPSTGFNRYAYGKRFKWVFRSNNPAVFTRLQLGVNLNASVNSDVNRNRNPDAEAIPQSYQKGEGIADFTISYGLPGKPGYTYTRPFDYFNFQFTAAGSRVRLSPESAMDQPGRFTAPSTGGPKVPEALNLEGEFTHEDYYQQISGCEPAGRGTWFQCHHGNSWG